MRRKIVYEANSLASAPSHHRGVAVEAVATARATVVIASCVTYAIRVYVTASNLLGDVSAVVCTPCRVASGVVAAVYCLLKGANGWLDHGVVHSIRTTDVNLVMRVVGDVCWRMHGSTLGGIYVHV